MTTRRVTSLILGCLLVLPSIGLVLAGSGLAVTYAAAKDSAGYVSAHVAGVDSPTRAITAPNAGLVIDAGTPDWVIRRLDADLRVRAARDSADPGLFVGVGRAVDVDAYLGGTSRDEVTGSDGSTPTYLRVDGQAEPGSPAAETFWLASASGSGPLTIDWAATPGDWVLVLMNRDGSPGVRADVTVGAKAGIVVPLALGVLGLGVALFAGASALILVAARGGRRGRQDDANHGQAARPQTPSGTLAATPLSADAPAESDRVVEPDRIQVPL